ncbi:class I SAM-dependent methyltransferase [Thermodesulfobacteriota bacterium]
MIDTGSYNADPENYHKLAEEVYTRYPEISLPPEYAQFIQEDLLRLLVRLARYKFVARMIRHTDRILEVGCGSGLGSIFLSQHCAHVTGLDVKATEVKEALSINRRENVTFRLGDFFEFPETERYDVIVALDVIEHMPEEEGQRLVNCMAGHLPPTGMAVVGSPSIHSYPYQGPLSRASHVRCYDQHELAALVDKCFGRTLVFSMNDEMVHTGFSKLAWYYFVLGLVPRDRE